MPEKVNIRVSISFCVSTILLTNIEPSAAVDEELRKKLEEIK